MKNEMIRVFDESFRYVGICDDYSYLNYKKCFQEAGDLTMRVVYTRANFALYTSCAYLVVPDGQCFAVDAIYSDGEEITVKGRDLLCLFERAVWSTEQALTARAEEILATLATSAAEVLPLTLQVASNGAGEEVTYDALPGCTYRLMQEVATVFGRGMALSYDFSTETLVFTAYAPSDRTAAQRERGPLILGRERENLAEEYYAVDRSAYCNGAVVVGEDSNGSLVAVTVPAPAGEPPRYLYCPAKNIRRTQYYTEAAFLQTLTRVGTNALVARGPRFTYTAVLNPHGETAVQPGDRVSVAALWGGALFEAVIASVETLYDRGSYSRRVVAGTVLPTFSHILGDKA
ncbi:MAG: hypothetical protein J6D21_12030 [Clostridia bacterium]|nr:hypothetical protein [Clostridia bacterium]